MPVSTTEAALILGQSEEYIRKMQREGKMPDPIPDDFLDPFVSFRLRLEEVMRRKVDERRLNGRADTRTDQAAPEVVGEAE